MAILGTWIDKTPGITLTGFTIATFNHSLGASSVPDEVRFVARSQASATIPSLVLGFGANQSLATVYAPSVIGATSVFGDLFVITYWGPVR